jgi:hypothetical protein
MIEERASVIRIKRAQTRGLCRERRKRKRTKKKQKKWRKRSNRKRHRR